MISRIVAYFIHLWLLAYFLDVLGCKEKTGRLIMTIDAVMMLILLVYGVCCNFWMGDMK